MSEEEKKAIDAMTRKMKLHEEKPTTIFTWLTLEEHYVRILLNLIEKQQKEIEGLKEKNKSIVYNYESVVDKLEESISKNKIKEKLNQIYEEYQEILNSNRNLYEKNVATFQHNAMRTVLEELLEE